MSATTMKARVLSFAGAAAFLLAGGAAEAQTLCKDVGETIVYVNGGGRVLMEALGQVLAGAGINLVFKVQGSCLAIDSILQGSGAPLTGTVAEESALTYYTPTGEAECDAPAGDPEPIVADIGISDVFPSTCLANLANGLPTGFADFIGPVEGYAFVVPKGSSQKVISQEAAYFVYGFGAASGVEPWIDNDFLFRRNEESGTQQMMGLAIGVPVDRWKGVDAGSSTKTIEMLQASTEPEKSIGIVTTEVASANPLAINQLAFQAEGQTCGYFPDSTQPAKDKRSIREGQYWIWGPLHFLTKLDSDGYPVNANAAKVINILTGVEDPPGGLDLIAVLADAGIVPQCAMHVTRTSELGPLASFQPERSCGCYFDVLATGATDCQSCESDAACPEEAPRCNFGYCEVQ